MPWTVLRRACILSPGEVVGMGLALLPYRRRQSEWESVLSERLRLYFDDIAGASFD